MPNNSENLADKNRPTRGTMGLPATGFTTGGLPDTEQFLAMREAVSSVGILTRHDPKTAAFKGYVRHYTLPSASFLRHGAGQACSVNRTAKIAEREGDETLSIQYRLFGQEWLHDKNGSKLFTAGDLVIKDLSQPYCFETSAYDGIAMTVPKKALFDRQIPASNLHGYVFDNSPMVNLLKQHMITVWEALPNISDKEAAAVSEISLDMLYAALLNATIPGASESEYLNNPIIQSIHAYIDENLHRAELCPDHIARAVAVSSSRLYRLCKPYGSPMELVRYKRLNLAKKLLNAGTFNTVNEVSYAVGFLNRETFSRAFKSEFGLSARDYITKIVRKAA